MRRHLLALAALLAAGPASAANIVIVNMNAPGVGFNDPTPAAPVGGNPGITLGEQRLLAFQHAADVWGAALDSAVEIRIQASFVPLSCTATSAVLGSAGAIQVLRDFPGADHPNTWYHPALANKLAFEDLIPGDPGTSADDLRARFNSELGTPTCLAGSGWYYGLDTGHAPSEINLVTVLLHEFAHGLGFSSFMSGLTGAPLAGFHDVYSKNYLDLTTGKTREEMTDAERVASAVNPRNVAWTGPKVTSLVPAVLQAGTPLLRVTAPPSAAGTYSVGAASFGAPLGSPGVSGDLALGAPADACTPITSDVAGKIAVVDRGVCGFVVKVKNAQNAGAIGVVVADNVAGGPPAGLGGADPTITIPSVRVTLADGNTLKAAMAGGAVTVTLGVDLAVRAGASPGGYALLYTPNPFQSGSSVSHWDTIATPNQLMEPAINGNLSLSVDAPQDLTRSLLRDIGWYPDGDLDGMADDAGDVCLGSDLRSTVVIGACDTGVTNTFFASGCTVRDYFKYCESGASYDERCVKGLLRVLNEWGYVSPDQGLTLWKATKGQCSQR